MWHTGRYVVHETGPAFRYFMGFLSGQSSAFQSKATHLANTPTPLPFFFLSLSFRGLPPTHLPRPIPAVEPPRECLTLVLLAGLAPEPTYPVKTVFHACRRQ